MKKFTVKLLSIYTIIVFIFSSCTKDRSCYCEIQTYSNNAASYTSSSNIEYKDVTKKWMKNSANCVSRTETEDNIDYNYALDANGYMIFDNFGNPIMIETPYTITTESDCEIN